VGAYVSGHFLLSCSEYLRAAQRRSRAGDIHSTFTLRAAGNAWNRIAKRVELWIDGKKVGQNLEDQLKVTTTADQGNSQASFVVVDSFDNYITQSETFRASY
jgi:hypothetical protein